MMIDYYYLLLKKSIFKYLFILYIYIMVYIYVFIMV